MQVDKEIQVRICPYCGYNKNEISQQACSDCGQIIPLTARIVTRVIKVEVESPVFSPEMRTGGEGHGLLCTKCNASNPSWGSFCAYCGQPLSKYCPGCGAENPSWGSFCISCGGHLPLGAQKRAVRTRIEYAGFWRRLVAYIIDIIILSIARTPFLFIATSTPYYDYYGFDQVITVLYFIGFWAWKGQTPGMMALGVRIVTEEGHPIATGRAIVRYFGYILCFLSAILFCLGFLWIGWDSRKQGWHDKLANTYVVKE